MAEPDHIRAHRHSSKHRKEIERSAKCGCFFCISIFAPDEIEEWIDTVKEVGTTALCPRCKIDSVIGDQSGFSITVDFLEKMEAHWFGMRSHP